MGEKEGEGDGEREREMHEEGRKKGRKKGGKKERRKLRKRSRRKRQNAIPVSGLLYKLLIATYNYMAIKNTTLAASNFDQEIQQV